MGAQRGLGVWEWIIGLSGRNIGPPGPLIAAPHLPTSFLRLLQPHSRRTRCHRPRLCCPACGCCWPFPRWPGLSCWCPRLPSPSLLFLPRPIPSISTRADPLHSTQALLARQRAVRAYCRAAPLAVNRSALLWERLLLLSPSLSCSSHIPPRPPRPHHTKVDCQHHLTARQSIHHPTPACSPPSPASAQRHPSPSCCTCQRCRRGVAVVSSRAPCLCRFGSRSF